MDTTTSCDSKHKEMYTVQPGWLLTNVFLINSTFNIYRKFVVLFELRANFFACFEQPGLALLIIIIIWLWLVADITRARIG